MRVWTGRSLKTPVAWHSDYLQVGKRHVQMFSLKTTPEASRPCLFSGLLRLDCDSVQCSTWRVKSTSSARSEIDAQEKFISLFKVGVLTRVMSGARHRVARNRRWREGRQQQCPMT